MQPSAATASPQARATPDHAPPSVPHCSFASAPLTRLAALHTAQPLISPIVVVMSAAAVSPTLVLISDRVCLPSVSAERLIPAAISVDRSSGRISAISTDAAAIAAFRASGSTADVEVNDQGSLVLMAGLVDTHVHCNEPGRTNWEGLETATRAAAAGGVTTIVDMPLNSIPPTTTMEGLRAKEAAAVGKLTVDLGLWGGIIPSNLKDLPELAAGGVCGFKCFTIESGVDEFPCVNPEQLKAAMEVVVASAPHLPVLVHAEACAAHEHAELTAAASKSDPRAYASYLASRPPSFESSAIASAISLAEQTGARMHVVHLSAQEGLPLFEAARARGSKNVSVETCPHYLTLDADTIPAGATAYKCAPPIREKTNQAALWKALRAGTIPMIVSDHSPCEPALKCLETGDFAQSWGGISSLQLGLPLIFSELRAQAEAAGETFDEDKAVLSLHEWMSAAPARFVHFAHRKGSLLVGHDADIVAWDPKGDVLVAKEMIHHRHKLTPYLGRTLRGAVRKTYLRGAVVYAAEEGQACSFSAPKGARVYPAEHAFEAQRAAEAKASKQ